MGHQRAGAVDGIALLVAGDEQAERARLGICPGACDGGDKGGDGALHVHRAASIEQLSAPLRAEGVAGPALAWRHHVEMAGEGDMFARAARAHRQQILDRGILAVPIEEALHCETKRDEHRLQAIEHSARRRRDGGAGDQRLGERDRIGEGGRGNHRAALDQLRADGKAAGRIDVSSHAGLLIVLSCTSSAHMP